MPTKNTAVLPDTDAKLPFFKLTNATQKPLVDAVVQQKSAGQGVETQTQTYMDRLRNYVPVEVLGFFIFCNAMVSAKSDGSDAFANNFVAIASVVVAIFAVILFTKMANAKAETQVWVVQAIVSCTAFLVWAYATGAEAVTLIGLKQEPVIAAFLLGTFSLFSGLIVPVKRLEGTKELVKDTTSG